MGRLTRKINRLQEKYSLEVREVSARCDMLCMINDELTAEIERYKILTFMVARIKVMEVGLRLGKSEQEINSMALDTASEMYSMINFDRAKEIYNAAIQFPLPAAPTL